MGIGIFMIKWNLKLGLNLICLVAAFSPTAGWSQLAPFQWRSGAGKCFGRWIYQKYSSCEHKSFGVKEYHSQRDPINGVETYNECEHPSFGVARYNSGTGPQCPGNIFRSGPFFNGHACKSLSEKMEYFPQVLSLLWKKSYICTTFDGQELVVNIEFFNGGLSMPAHKLTFGEISQGRHPSFGIETYVPCEHPDFGIAAYNKGRHPDCGVDQYNLGTHRSFGAKTHKSGRGIVCNNGIPEPFYYSTKEGSQATASPYAAKSLKNVPVHSAECTTGDDLPASTKDEVVKKYRFLRGRVESFEAQADSPFTIDQNDGQKILSGPISERELKEVVSMLKELGRRRQNDLNFDDFLWISRLSVKYPDHHFKVGAADEDEVQALESVLKGHELLIGARRFSII